MSFLIKLTDGIPALLLFAIFLVLSGTVWVGFQGDQAGGNRTYYVWPLIGIIVLLVLIVAWVKLVF